MKDGATKDRTPACIVCGRGEIAAERLALLPEVYRSIDWSLDLRPCDDPLAHRPPAGRHIGICFGFVFVHRDHRICDTLRAQAAAVPVHAAGAN